MPGISFFKGTAVALATLGVVFPQTRLLAGEQMANGQKRSPKPTIKVAAPNTVFDVKLTKDGEFSGRVINHNGTAVEGAEVVIKQGNTEVAQSVSDEHGNFAFENLKSGVYEVRSGATAGTYRMWTEKTAPPSSKPHGLLVLGENGARGQYGLTETIVGENLGLILLASATGLALAGVILAIQADHISKEAKNIANQAFHSP